MIDNIPYKVQRDENGNVANPITKHKPYQTIFPTLTRQQRRLQRFDTVFKRAKRDGIIQRVQFEVNKKGEPKVIFHRRLPNRN